MKTTTKNLERLLTTALLHDGKMEYGLFKYELKELVDEFIESLLENNNEFLFAITTHKNDIMGKQDTAMILIEQSGEIYIDESARDKLKTLWEGAYATNMKKLIPVFAKQLYKGEMPINGVKSTFQA